MINERHGNRRRCQILMRSRQLPGTSPGTHSRYSSLEVDDEVVRLGVGGTKPHLTWGYEETPSGRSQKRVSAAPTGVDPVTSRFSVGETALAETAVALGGYGESTQAARFSTARRPSAVSTWR